jgi:hypothetical protein
MYLYPGDQPYSPAAFSSWALSTVITCGLGLPLGNVTNIQVDNPPHGFEVPMSNAALSDPGRYHDPAAPGPLPVVSVDGTENQNTYVRPWLGGSDDNAADEVIADGAPITIVVYENGPPLSVNVTERTTSRSATSMTVRLHATVRIPDGMILSPSGLTWSWNFGDGTASAVPAPRHSFVPGVYPVTVQVSDPEAGTGGTATYRLGFSTASRTGSGNRSGGGRSGRSNAPSGPANSRGTRPGGAPGAANSGSTTPAGSHGSGAAPATAVAARAGRAGAIAASSRNAPEPPASRHAASGAAQARGRPQVTNRSKPAEVTRPDAPVVEGRLISAVTPLPPGVSPLLGAPSAAPASAPAVRGVTRSSILPIVGVLLVVLVLFGLGAARELRGPFGRRAVRSPGWSP